MFALGQEEQKSGEEVVEQKMSAIQSAAELRDQLFDENQWAAVKVIGGTLLGLYLVYRYLFKQV